MPIIKPFSVNGVEYKSQREYFFAKNTDRETAMCAEIKMFCYHTIPEYREHIMEKNKNRYRNKHGGVVNFYRKFDRTTWDSVSPR